MENSDTTDESAFQDDSCSSNENSNLIHDNNSNKSDGSKRKLVESESPTSSTLKKARYSWQVKGSKEKSDESATDPTENASETSDLETVKSATSIHQPVLDTSDSIYDDRQTSNISDQCHRQTSNISDQCHEVSNQKHELGHSSDAANPHHEARQPFNVRNQNRVTRQPPDLSNQQMFHSMYFDPRFAFQTASLRVDNPDTIPQEHLDILSNYLGHPARVNPGPMPNPPRMRLVSSPLHSCMVNAIIPVIRPVSNANPIPNPPTASVSVVNPNNTTNTSTNNNVRSERDEFRAAVHSIRRPNLSEYEKWEKRNTAGAIVDNVFNRTLEEMGISPDAASNRRTMDRAAVEAQSILAAISSQGLTTDRTAETSEVHDDFEYLRQNRAVINRTFENLGYRRFDTIQRIVPNNQGPVVHLGLAGNRAETATSATQTSGDIVSTQHDEDDGLCAHDNKKSQSEVSNSESDTSAIGRYRAEVNISVEDIPTSSGAAESDVTPCTENKQVHTKANTDNITCDVSRDNDKDTGVSENVLNLALTAAIQSQGLTLK